MTEAAVTADWPLKQYREGSRRWAVNPDQQAVISFLFPYNEALIATVITATNACADLCPHDPQRAAEKIGEAFELLRASLDTLLYEAEYREAHLSDPQITQAQMEAAQDARERFERARALLASLEEPKI